MWEQECLAQDEWTREDFNNIQSSSLARHFDPVIDTKRDQRVN